MERDILQRSRPEVNGRVILDQPVTASTPHVTVELLKYWSLYVRHWKIIAPLALAAMVAVAAWGKVFATVYYQAMATITPVPPSDFDTGNNTGLSSMLGGGGSGGGGFASLLSGGSDNTMISQNYISIMNSFDFTMNLVKRYHLLTRLIAKTGDDPAAMTPWNVYQRINGSFGTDYDYKSGNLTLTFISSDPSLARQVLGYYLQALQDKLRSAEVQEAAVAIESLKEEISNTSDTLLQQQLYQLMAYQIQREKLAQMQADFAFKVIEPPFVPGHKYSPTVTMDTLLAGIVVVFICCAFLTFREWLRLARRHLESSAAATMPDRIATRNDDLPGENERIIGASRW
jgi:hypothetical protein